VAAWERSPSDLGRLCLVVKLCQSMNGPPGEQGDALPAGTTRPMRPHRPPAASSKGVPHRVPTIRQKGERTAPRTRRLVLGAFHKKADSPNHALQANRFLVFDKVLRQGFDRVGHGHLPATTQVACKWVRTATSNQDWHTISATAYCRGVKNLRTLKRNIIDRLEYDEAGSSHACQDHRPDHRR
jgi:hypothetical protein